MCVCGVQGLVRCRSRAFKGVLILFKLVCIVQGPSIDSDLAEAVGLLCTKICSFQRTMAICYTNVSNAPVSRIPQMICPLRNRA